MKNKTHKMSTTLHKSAPTNVVTYLKKNRSAVNDSIDHKSSQYEKINEDISSASSKISVIGLTSEILV